MVFTHPERALTQPNANAKLRPRRKRDVAVSKHGQVYRRKHGTGDKKIDALSSDRGQPEIRQSNSDLSPGGQVERALELGRSQRPPDVLLVGEHEQREA